MLEYMIEATKDVMSLMLILGMMFAYKRHAYSKMWQKVFHISVIAGVAAAAWMAYMKNATNKMRTDDLNLIFYDITFIALAAFIVFTIIENKAHIKKISAACIALSLYAFMLLFVILPDFIAYPYTLKVAETTVFSSSYVLKLSGVLVGFVLTLIASFAADHMGRRLGKNGSLAFLLIMSVLMEIKQLGTWAGSMIRHRYIQNNHALFQFSVYIQNHGDLFIYLTMASACAAAVVMLIRSAHVNEPYSNPAQHRKIRAKWIRIRRWASTSLVTTALAVVLMTAVNSVVNAEVTIAPAVEATIEDGNAVVNFEDVDDGHLHRFSYTTDNGVTVRFIVIKKPNSTTYGVGMDCCDICGETGYYENNSGDVVCSRCNVIMNINTIGFKGGCNPKVVDYKVENSQIIIPVEQLTQYEKDFK